MQSVGGKFRVSFLLTKAWYTRKFPSTFSPQMQYVASRKFHQHCTNGWRIWVEKYVHIFLTTDAQCLQKTSERIFHTDAEYRRKTRSVSSSVQNVGEDYCSTCEVIYQAWDTVFHDQMKHWKESWKYHVQRSVFDHLRSVSSGDETLGRMLDITSQTKWF